MTDFLPQEIIRRKRDKGDLSDVEIDFLVSGLTDGSLSEGQAAAFAMAVYFNGLARRECVALTRAMTQSGAMLDWKTIDRPVLDKHSTGGVGDKVSLILAPILAACGAAVPMISGRGLGHTGGTLDKLEAIPGYCATPSLSRFQEVVATAGCAIIGQTAELAPADRRLYAIRDVTATVESIPLITASILSKKLAAGLGGLVMDVKLGNGAFMTSLEDAQGLAHSIVEVAQGAGLPCRALITDMNQVLGRTAGNALEVAETVAYLTTGPRDSRLRAVVEALCCELLCLSGLADSQEEAKERVLRATESGAAAACFQGMIAALGGPSNFLQKADHHLPKAPVIRPVFPSSSGVVAAQDTRDIGLAVVALGGGRQRADQEVDPTVGFSELAALGERVDEERPLALVHARDEAGAARAEASLRQAYRVSEAPPSDNSLIYSVISA